MTAAVLSPHLDDAVLSAWSALRSDDDVVVVNVFDGVPAAGTLGRWDRVTGATDSSERMHERLQEDRRALELAGCRAVSLGLLEVEYRAGPPDPDELVRALARATGDAEVIWAPAGIGGHADHILVRDWALAEVMRGRALRLYADLPYAARHGWPAWVVGDDPYPYFSHEAAWERFMPGDGVVLAPDAHRLSEREAELKLRAIREYTTQFHGISGGPVGPLGHPQAIGHEVSWSVSPPGP